jgi:cysteine desulfurase / selenocysteine lyase
MMLNHRADFPVFDADPELIYLDTGATAHKPRAVIDAITRAYATDYATVHRGVYRRSQDMTEAYEAARVSVAGFMNAKPAEIIFVRGATEAINLVAQTWGRANIVSGDEVVLTALEHHSNIVPWQLLRDALGFTIKVIPVTAEGDLDYAAAAQIIGPRTKMLAVTHVSNVLGTIIDIPRLAALAHAQGAKILVDGCQAAPRMAIDVAALNCDFYTFSAHKLYGPTGFGILWGRSDILNAMPPYQGGGAMIETVSFERSTYLPAPLRFEAGTPHIVGALGLMAAINYVDAVGLENIAAHEAELVAATRATLRHFNSVQVLGPEKSSGIVSFVMQGVHPHDIGTILDEQHINIRAGHHCAQPLMDVLDVPATARASFGIYNNASDVEKLGQAMEKVVRIFR